jgi:hypothetical protein
VFKSADQYIEVMNLKTAVQTTKHTKHTKDRNKGLTLCGFVCLVYFVVLMAAAADNPYQGIVERNVFGLKPPPPPPSPEDNKPPPPKIILTGITTILGNKRALLKFTPPPKPGEPAKEQAFTLAEGEREGGLEVLEIDEKAATVKVNNYGTVATLDFESNGIKTPTAAPGVPPQPGMPPAIRPGLPMPGGVPGAVPMPARPLRMPGTGASVTPQATAGTGVASANPVAPPPQSVEEAAANAEMSQFLLEVNRIKYQPLVEKGEWPPLPPGDEGIRAAILGTDSAEAQTAAPTPATPVMPPRPPGGPQPFPPQATQ